MAVCYSKSLYHPGKLETKAKCRSGKEMMCHLYPGRCRRTGSKKGAYVVLKGDPTIDSALNMCHPKANTS